MLWKPISITGPAGAFKVTDQETGRGDVSFRLDRAPSAEWTRIFEELWSGIAQVKIDANILYLSGITKSDFLESCSDALEKCLQEANDKQAEQVAQKMGMPFSKQEATYAARAAFRSAIDRIDWGA